MIVSSSVWGNKWPSIYCGMSLHIPCCQGAPDRRLYPLLIRSCLDTHTFCSCPQAWLSTGLCGFWRILVHLSYAAFPQKYIKNVNSTSWPFLVAVFSLFPSSFHVMPGFAQAALWECGVQEGTSVLCFRGHAKFQPFELQKILIFLFAALLLNPWVGCRHCLG